MKKGQAAMEFLMTYGWAILVVLVAIGALAYFGVLSPARFLPSSCTLIPGMSCDESQVAPDGGTGTDITLIVTNGMGEDLTNVAFTVDCDGDGTDTSSSTAIPTWADGSKETVNIACDTSGGDAEPTGTRFKSDITITYTADTLTHSATGTLTAQVE